MGHGLSKTLRLIGLYLRGEEDSSLIFDEKESNFLLNIGRTILYPLSCSKRLKKAKPPFPKQSKKN